LHYAALTLHLKVLLFLLYNDDMVPFRPSFPPMIVYIYTTNWENLKVGGGAQGPVSQNFTSSPLSSLRVLELSRALSNPFSPKTNRATLVHNVYMIKRTEQPWYIIYHVCMIKTNRATLVHNVYTIEPVAFQQLPFCSSNLQVTSLHVRLRRCMMCSKIRAGRCA